MKKLVVDVFYIKVNASVSSVYKEFHKARSRGDNAVSCEKIKTGPVPQKGRIIVLPDQIHLFDPLEFLTRRVFIKRDFKTLLFCITRGVASNTKPYILNGI